MSWPQDSALQQNHRPCPPYLVQKQDILGKRALHGWGPGAERQPSPWVAPPWLGAWAGRQPSSLGLPSLTQQRAFRSLGLTVILHGGLGAGAVLYFRMEGVITHNLQLVQGLSHVHKYL